MNSSVYLTVVLVQYFLIIVDQLKDVYFRSLTRVLEIAGSFSSAAIQESCLKVGIKFDPGFTYCQLRERDRAIWRYV